MVTENRQLHDPCGGVVCLDFVNTLSRPLGKPRVDCLHDFADLATWSAQAGTLAARQVATLVRLAKEHPRKAAHVLRRARTLREAIHEAFLAVIRHNSSATGLTAINAELAHAMAHAQLVRDGAQYRWTWNFEPLELEAPLWPIVRSAADLLVDRAHARVKECPAEPCRWLFLDGTKNGKRRWCEMKTCGNRAKVREFRRRNQGA